MHPAQSKKNPEKIQVDLKNGKNAQTQWELVADFGSVSLLAVRLLTERTHQIRVHLQHAGMPLAIDPLYGQNQAIMLSSFKADYKLGKYSRRKTAHRTDLLFVHINLKLGVLILLHRWKKSSRRPSKCSQNTTRTDKQPLIMRKILSVCWIRNHCC